MNESKYYYFDKLKHIYILGASNFFDEVIAVNNKLKLSTNIISTSHQVKEFKLGKKVIIIIFAFIHK